jgi:hypothetical protein
MSIKPEIYDDDDTVFGDWSDAVPWKMERWTEHKLQMAHVYGSGQTIRFVESELFRRRNLELRKHIEQLKWVTDSVRDATIGVKDEVGNLTASSETLENLTRKLIKLTNVLIILTILAGIIPMGIEIWHARQPEKPVQVVVQLPQSPEPQTPSHPAH